VKKLAFGLSCLYLLSMCGCEKSGCQTALQGAWVVRYPKDSAKLAIDSVFFYGGDSIIEKYKYRLPGDTLYQNLHSTYYIDDQCDEVDFNGDNTWAQLSSTLKFNILVINTNNVQIRSKADPAICDSCIVSFYR